MKTRKKYRLKGVVQGCYLVATRCTKKPYSD